jgi:pyruvate/2-oxoglutarate dehydrogenase complex dihydrolipoamide acyltransferase (E2) component
MPSREIVLPELAVDNQPVVVSLWLVKRGTRVSAGEPVVEVLAGCVTVDLPAPADGILAEFRLAEGEAVAVGQCLGVVESESPGS